MRKDGWKGGVWSILQGSLLLVQCVGFINLYLLTSRLVFLIRYVSGTNTGGKFMQTETRDKRQYGSQTLILYQRLRKWFVL